MIPINILSKMGIYELKIPQPAKAKFKVNVKVEVTVIVIDSVALINRNIADLRSLLQRPVVGFDVKFGIDGHKTDTKIAKLLILYVEDRCLIIQLDRLASVPDCLKDFLGDETICFVGTYMEDKTDIEDKVKGFLRYDILCRTGVEVGDLVSRVLKTEKFSTLGLASLCYQFGLYPVTITGVPETTPDRNARFFTDVEVEYAIFQARSCYRIGNLMLSKLNL
ncbi:hypothetical protein Ddye_028146 [Dipteronia dyeriana]|uniref:3'-5' exonuclease domain-containing protein n=1 Tax=Dipteronia dyeriana TaxID=168575 RepID=A0AAD9WR56_9ROSI|nr:hypothetical protein Ddye_028146 [Dipteronia dyeriana]